MYTILQRHNEGIWTAEFCSTKESEIKAQIANMERQGVVLTDILVLDEIGLTKQFFPEYSGKIVERKEKQWIVQSFDDIPD